MLKKSILVYVATAVLFGCGGSSSEDSTNLIVPALSTAVPGFYSGINRPEGSAADVELDIMIAQNGEMRGISQSQFILSSNLSLQDRAFSSERLINFEPNPRGDGIFFGNAIQEGSISGVKTGNTIEGNSYFGDKQSIFNLQQREISAPSNFEAISGSFIDQTSSAEMSIDLDGVLTGLDSFGCVYFGNISSSSLEQSILNISLTVENCGDYSADYEGVVGYAPEQTFANQEQAWLIFAVDNTELSMTTIMLAN